MTRGGERRSAARGRRQKPELALQHGSVLGPLATQAIRLGTGELDVEYKGGFERVFAVKNGVGWGIASLASSSTEAALLRDELRDLTRRRRRLTVDDCAYELRARVYDSFGEDAFHVDLRRV